MKKRFNSIRQSPLLRRLIQVISGNSAAQLLVILAAPIITRIYSPEVFGIQGVFLAAISLLAPLVALRYPMAIVLGRGDRQIRQAEQASLLIAFFTCTLLLVLLIVVREPISALLGLEQLGLLVLFLPLMLFFTALQEIADYRAARFNCFREVGLVTAIQAFLVNGGRIVGGILHPAASTLVMASTAGPAVHTGLLRLFTKETSKQRPVAPRETMKTIGVFLKSQKDFPLFRAPADLLSAASHALPVILLTSLSGPIVAGFYTLARSVVNLPANVVGSAIGKVYYAHFAEKARSRKPLLGSGVKSSLVLFAGPGLAVIAICFFAPHFFAIVFGSEWREAGTYARWMSIWVATGLAMVPSVRLAPVIGKQGLLLAYRVFSLITQVGTMVLTQQFTGEPTTMVIAYSLVSALLNGILMLIMFVFTRVFDRNNMPT